MPVADKSALRVAHPAVRRESASHEAQRQSWITDFAWQDGQLLIRKTQIRLRMSWPLINEIVQWAVYLAILNVVAAWTHVRGVSRPRIWYAPDRPRPWYLIRGAAMWAGIDLAADSSAADAAVYFDDSTSGFAPPVATGRRINHGCVDISKSHVAAVFARVFGYTLTLDPMATSGEIVEKPEKNGVHGGRIVMAPLPPAPGMTYQRIVDTRDDDGCCQDLRTPCAGGKPVLVWVKVKTPQGRFSINNHRAYLAHPGDIYSTDEMARISEFCAVMGLDWGGLDILRDRGDGRIYIVDVNKTDLGPVIALSWRDKIVSMGRLGQALRALVTSQASSTA